MPAAAIEAAPTADQDPLGVKTATVVLPIFLDFYRQEVAAEEDVHRTLPFFATALGLIVAALNYVAGQLPAWSSAQSACTAPRDHSFYATAVGSAWPVSLAMVLLASASLLALAVPVLLYFATSPRVYERIGPEPAHLQRAAGLRSYYAAQLLSDEALDEAVSRDLRDQLVKDLAEALPLNRRLTLRR